MKRISLVVLCVMLLVVSAVLACGVTFYWHYISNMLERDMTTNIMAAGNEIADGFRRAVEADQRVVDTIAITVQTNYPWDANPEKMERFLHLQVKYNEFANLGITPLRGKTRWARPSSLNEAWQREMLLRTLDEDTFVSERQVDPDTGRGIFVQAASLHNGEEPVGALFALIPTKRYHTLLTLSSLGEDGNAVVISSRSGQIEAAGRPMNAKNVFDILKEAQFAKHDSFESLRRKIRSGQTTFVRYHLDGQYRLLFGVALPINDWYLLAVLPTDSIQAQAHRLTRVSLGLFVFIFALFGLLGWYMLRLRAYSNRQLFQTAFVDPLTGADNLNRMTMQFAKNLRALGGQASLVLFDISKFKVINDMLGYEQGNQVLQHTADLFRDDLSPEERLCRISADKFILLLAAAERRELRERLQKLLSSVRRECTVVDSHMMVDGVFGVYEVREDMPFYIALDRAHMALENAKHSSKDFIQFYAEKDRHRILQERQLENEMERALDNHDFTLMLQPKYNLQTNQMEGAEALVRWNQSEQGLLRPDTFIPLFERNGFILKLDMFILEEVVKFLAKWRSDGKHQVPVAVNFSRLHLNDSRYIPQMTNIVDMYDVPRHLIEVELTESVILNNRDLAQSVIRGLHNKGFSVAMDDFGSGYSSLNVLKNLQFDSIKLDKEFLYNCTQNETARKVVQGAVEMVRAIGAKVIAEGVETAEQADFLRNVGCDLAQGYFFARPLSTADFEKLLSPLHPTEE